MRVYCVHVHCNFCIQYCALYMYMYIRSCSHVMAMSGSAAMYHCVFGNLEESLQKCIWSALEGNCSEESPAIAFWLDGFTAINGESALSSHVSCCLYIQTCFDSCIVFAYACL